MPGGGARVTQSRRSQLFRWLGGALGLLAATLVVWRFHAQAGEMGRLLQSRDLLAAVVAGCLAMGGAGFLLSEAWRVCCSSRAATRKRWHSIGRRY